MMDDGSDVLRQRAHLGQRIVAGHLVTYHDTADREYVVLIHIRDITVASTIIGGGLVQQCLSVGISSDN